MELEPRARTLPTHADALTLAVHTAELVLYKGPPLVMQIVYLVLTIRGLTRDLTGPTLGHPLSMMAHSIAMSLMGATRISAAATRPLALKSIPVATDGSLAVVTHLVMRPNMLKGKGVAPRDRGTAAAHRQ